MAIIVGCITSFSLSLYAAEGDVAYTLDFTAATTSHGSYTDSWDYGTDFNLTAGSNNNKNWAYVKFGGKGGSETTSTSTINSIIKSKAVIASEKTIKKITIEHTQVTSSNYTANKCTLEVASNSTFATIIDTRIIDSPVKSGTSFDLTPNSLTVWPASSYYRITIGATIKGKSNIGVDVSKVKFIEGAASTTKTLLYNANGASGSVPEDETAYEVGDDATVAGQNTLYKVGFTFAGWNTAADGSGTPYSTGSSYTIIDGTNTLYAQWTNTYANEVFNLVEDLSDLHDGSKIIILNAAKNYAISRTQGDNYRTAVAYNASSYAGFALSNSDKTVTLASATTVQVITLKDLSPTPATNTYQFYVESGYLYAASSSKNYLRTQTPNDANGHWLIGLSAGTFSVVAQGTNTNNTLQRNSSDAFFSCYSTSQENVLIYAKEEGTKYDITWSSAHGTTPTSPTSAAKVTLPELTETGWTHTGWKANQNVTNTANDETIEAGDLISNSTKVELGANTTFTAQWSANTISLTLDKNNNDASGSTDGSATIKFDATALESGTTHATRNYYILEGYYAEAECTNKVLTSAGALVDYSGYVEDGQWVRETTPTTLYANWTAKTYNDYKFSCAELTLTSKLVTASTPIFITSAASKTVRSQDSILIVGSGLTPSKALEFPDLPSKFSIRSRANGELSTKADGTIDTVAYIFYTPGSGDTSDGIDKLTGIKVKVDGAKPYTQSLDQVIIGRHVATNFVIAAKFADNKWYALPADKANGNLTPVSIRVNSESAPTTAYCENTNSFTLYQDNTSNSPKVVLGLTNFRNDKDVSYALFGSSSGSTIGKSDGTVTGSIGDQYKWTLVQQATSVSGLGDVKYQITVTNNAQPLAIRTYSGSTNWGLHANSGTLVTEMRLLTLEAVQPLTLSVMEWGTDAIVVSYPNGGSASSVQTAIGDATPSSVTMTSLGGDLYKISTISGLQSNPSKPLYIMATESGTSKQAVLSIPLIVTDAKTEAQLRESLPGANATERNKTAKYIDVIIRDGGTMTTGTASGNFADLYIYPGGKAIVSNNMSFGTIYMRGGYSFLDNKATYKYPDLCVKEGTMTTSGVKYDLFIDNRLYYKFAMPTNVTLASVTDETGSEDFPVWVKHYDGAKRATGAHVNGWEWYGDEEGQESFKAGVGYEITAKPRVSGRPLAIIRFPVKSGNITSDANDTTKVAVTNYGKSAYDSGDLAANNVGWNLVGNPYLTAFKATSDTSMIIDKSYEPADVAEGETWDGTYKWVSSPARFVTVPYDMQNDFHHEYVKNCTIPAFSAFFIQVVESGIFKMAGTRTQAAAPWRYDAAQKGQPEMHLDVLLHGNNEAVEAKAGLIIHDKYEGGLKDFEDVEQWFVDQNEQKTYTFANGTALAYNLLNEQAAMQIIPMGYIATAAGEHTYSLDESNDVSGLEHLWLTDYMTGVTTDLLVHGYSFTTEAGRFDERFAISAVFNREEVVTEIVSTGDDDWTKAIGVYHDGNTLTLRGLPENSSAYVYDMTGKLIASGQHLHNVASFNIAAQGVYNIRVVDGEKAVTLRCVLQ